MIAEIIGTLTALENGRAMIALENGWVIEALVPSYTASRLGGSFDQPVHLYTLLHLESVNQGSSFTPRLLAFETRQDKAFFELFTTVKSIGPKKALRALALPAAQIAGAIADRDVATLQSLPEIGKRTAETIIVTLKDKVDDYLTAPAATTSNGSASSTEPLPATGGTLARDALAVLLQLGESRQQASAWIERALSADEAPSTADALVTAAYRFKAGG